jgi:cytochrome c oxidase assembly factor CtaG
MRIAQRTAFAIAMVATETILSAHEFDSITEPRALSPFDLLVIGLLVAMGAMYLVGSIRLARRQAYRRSFEPVAFAVGWVALLAATLPPLDALAIQLFSAHMAQHELMMLVGAPLVMLGRPLPVWLAGLSPAVRSRVAAVLQSRTCGGVWRVLTAPLVAWTLHGAAIWLWHLPRLYDLAVDNEAIHLVQHATFVGTSILFWWGMLYGRYGRTGYGAAVFYVFTTAVHTGILGAMVTFAGAPLYDVYLAPAATRGIDALHDQQVAGLIMWVPAGFILTALGIALFAAWLGESERRVRAVE